MLLCDGCDAPWHTYCLSPPLEGVPDGDWFCPACTVDEAAADAAASMVDMHRGSPLLLRPQKKRKKTQQDEPLHALSTPMPSPTTSTQEAACWSPTPRSSDASPEQSPEQTSPRPHASPESIDLEETSPQQQLDPAVWVNHMFGYARGRIMELRNEHL